MSGTWTHAKLRTVRGRAALTLVFAGVLATGAVTGSWGDDSGDGSDGAGRALAGAAAAPQSFVVPSEGRPSGGAQSAEELVSRSGDRWSAAYTAREYEGLRQTLAGRYVGVGVSVHRSGGPEGRETVSVAEVRPGGPADEAGIRPGDRLHAVDGRAVAGWPVTDVVAQLRGSPGSAVEMRGPGLHPSSAAKPGSTVRLVLGRDGRHRHVTLHRARLDAQTVAVDRLSDSVTRITVTCFTEGAGREVRRAVEQAPAGTGFLLDLRGNSGGLVDEAVAGGLRLPRRRTGRHLRRPGQAAGPVRSSVAATRMRRWSSSSTAGR